MLDVIVVSLLVSFRFDLSMCALVFSMFSTLRSFTIYYKFLYIKRIKQRKCNNNKSLIVFMRSRYLEMPVHMHELIVWTNFFVFFLNRFWRLLSYDLSAITVRFFSQNTYKCKCRERFIGTRRIISRSLTLRRKIRTLFVRLAHWNMQQSRLLFCYVMKVIFILYYIIRSYFLLLLFFVLFYSWLGRHLWTFSISSVNINRYQHIPIRFKVYKIEFLFFSEIN